MIDWILVAIALAAGGGADAGGGTSTAVATAPAQEFQAEPQQPSGKFTTATEVKPILTMTKANWVAVREYNGQDLLYVTQLLSWRCGLLRLQYSINGGPMQDWPLPPCLNDTAQPNAIRTEDGLPYEGFAPGSIESVRVELLYDDLSTDSAEFSRSDVLMP